MRRNCEKLTKMKTPGPNAGPCVQGLSPAHMDTMKDKPGKPKTGYLGSPDWSTQREKGRKM